MSLFSGNEVDVKVKQTRLASRLVVLPLVFAMFLTAVPAGVLGVPLGTNPPDTSIRARLKDAALRHNIPSVILMAIAYQESGWRQFDAGGNPIIGTNATSQDVGIMQINTSGRNDVDRLMSDIDYNIDIGARILDGKWKVTPGIGDGDRNVLENWYYAIWAYNGFSSTNNPNTVGGRHYQDRVLALMARQVLGSDGQPLWQPVSVTLPNPAMIANPPAWIPTPEPVHYGDLYAGFNRGDNFRVLESPAGAVLSTAGGTAVRFLLQNVGTTTWDTSYVPVLAVGDPVITSLQGQPCAQAILPGASVPVTFALPPALPAGALSMTLSMTRSGAVFGAGWQAQATIVDIAATAAMPDSLVQGSLLDVPIQVSSTQPLTVTPGFELRDMQGTLVDSSSLVARRYGTPVGIVPVMLPGQQSGDIRYFAGATAAGLLQPGQYQLTVNFTAGLSALEGVSGTVPFASITHPLQVLPAGQPGLLIVDPVPVGASVSVDGSVQPVVTPCAVPTIPGLHVIQVTGANMLPVAATVDTSAAPVTLVAPTLTPVAETPVTLTPSPVNLDFGVLKAGAGVTGQVTLQVSGTAGAQGVVSASANWIRVSPLTFDGSQVFTVGVDGRWLDPNAANTGKITFTMGSTTVAVPVKAGFAPIPTIGFVLSPQSVQVGMGDEFELNLTARNLQLLFDHVDLTVAWDPALVSFKGIAASSSLTAPPVAPGDPGILRIQSDVTGFADGQSILAVLRFTALGQTEKTGINLRGTVTLGGSPVRSTMGGSAVTINQHFVLPGMPDGFSAAGEQGQVRLSWRASTTGTYPIARYDIYRKQGASDLETAELVGEAAPDATQFLDRGPLERATYYYWVMCEDTRGNVSNPAGPVKVQPIINTDPVAKITLVFSVNKPSVVMNGVTVPMDTAPVIENGRTILPVRYIATPLGAQVLWSPKEQKVTLVGSKRVELWIGKPTARVDGVDVLIDPDNPKVAPRIVSGRTMLPLRFISETFGASIVYDPKLQTVTVTLAKGA